MNPSQLTTLLTLICFLLGLVSSYMASIPISIVGVGLLLALAYLTPQYNHLRRSQFVKCLVTMYVFGLLDGYYAKLMESKREFDPFGVFVILSTIRYYGEFQLINNYHHHQLEWESFLIYHSKMYLLTNTFLLIEHIVTRHIFQLSYKQSHPLILPAFVVAVFSLLLRVAAFYTAKQNFTHKVSCNKKSTHSLVKNGVYAIFRHPSYTGFFYFTVASMIMIGNFISALLFGLMLSLFFDDRIQFQQHFLLRFFGQQYENYRNKTYIGIPYMPKKIKKLVPFLE